MKLKTLIMAITVGFSFIACEKNENDMTVFDKESVQIAVDDNHDLMLIDNVVQNIEMLADLDESNLKSAVAEPTCPTITRSGKTFPLTMTIDYGTGCTDKDGKLKTGKVIVVKSAPWNQAGAQRTMTFEDFTVAGVAMAGNRISTNNGVADNIQSFTWNEDITITRAEGKSVHRTSNHVRSFIAGFATSTDRSDDIIQITGSSNVVRSDQTSYSRTIVQPLVRKGDCSYIVSGVVEITRANAKKVTMDYGDGSCDDKATVTNGEKTKEVVLK
ncbi:MAG: hypothetical protein RBS73_01170 [Prolixibacteraceae bacterium]|jgi:hypothetical protein|nr:hypothetical protein [Prolixibacteraceae bacterium]